MTTNDRTMIYPMVPAPGAGQSGMAFGALVLAVLTFRFCRYGRLSPR